MSVCMVVAGSIHHGCSYVAYVAAGLAVKQTKHEKRLVICCLAQRSESQVVCELLSKLGAVSQCGNMEGRHSIIYIGTVVWALAATVAQLLQHCVLYIYLGPEIAFP